MTLEELDAHLGAGRMVRLDGGLPYEPFYNQKALFRERVAWESLAGPQSRYVVQRRGPFGWLDVQMMPCAKTVQGWLERGTARPTRTPWGPVWMAHPDDPDAGRGSTP